MNILANDGISPSGLAALETAGHTVHTDFIEADALGAFINDHAIDGLLVRSATKVRQPLIDACPGLKFIGRGGVGIDNIDADYARSKGITVFNTPASSSQSVAELVMGHLFSLSRFLNESFAAMPMRGATDFNSLKKAYGKGVELRGKRLAIVGMGRIGQSLASYALGAGMEVVGVDREPGSCPITWNIGGTEVTVNLPLVGMDEALATADAISLHIPAQPGGGAVIGAAQFAAMKDGVLLVNAARGGVVDEDALLDALQSGKVRAAGLDVFVGEPAPRADLLAHPRVAATPHIGAATVEAQDRIGLEIAEIVSQLASKVNA
jgi:D-3-phosphoglycerate dehydrogenase